MKARLRIFIYLLLALSLVASGLPAFGASLANDADPIDVQIDAGADCPFHRVAIADSQMDTMNMCSTGHDCCGTDCRCACASLSMLVIPRFQSPLNPLPANLPHSANSLLAELYGSRLLRPPQA